MIETGSPFALTMPEAEAAELARVYGAGEVILEYGAGGSTVLAAGMAGKVVQSVESDAGFARRMAEWFDVHPPAADLRLHLADIGPTRDYGWPKDDRSFRHWPGYATSVWTREDFAMPDTVLIDGRFRLACFLTVLANITRAVTLLWDDYAARPAYHKAEALARPVAMIGRMARFHLTPMAVPFTRLPWAIEAFLRPL